MNKLYIVLSNPKSDFKNILNFYFRNFDFEIIPTQLLQKIKGNILFFKSDGYPLKGTFSKIEQIIKSNELTFLSSDSNILFIPEKDWEFKQNNMEIKSSESNAKRIIIFDTTRPYSIKLHDPYEKIGESYNFLYNSCIKNDEKFINIYNKNLSLKAISDFLQLENIKNNFMLVVYFINQNNFFDIISKIGESKYKYVRYLLVLEDKFLMFEKEIQNMIQVLLKKRKYIALSNMKSILTNVVNMGLCFETILFSDKLLDLPKIDQDLNINKFRFNQDYISLPLNIFVQIPFINSKQYPIRNRNEFIRHLMWFSNDKYESKLLLDSVYVEKFNSIKNNQIQMNTLNYNIIETNLMLIKDYESLLVLISDKINKNYDIKRHHELILKKITIAILTEKENLLEKNLVSTLVGFTELSLLETIALLIERTKFSQIKGLIWFKILTKIENNIQKKINVLSKCLNNEQSKDNFTKLCDYLITDDKLREYIIEKNIQQSFILSLLNQSIIQNNDEQIVEKINTIFEKLYPNFSSLTNLDSLLNQTFNFNTKSNLIFNNFIISNAIKFDSYYKSYDDFTKNRLRIKNNLIKIIENIKFTTDLNQIVWFRIGNFELSYQGVPSADIFQLKAQLVRKICPELNYKIPTNFTNNKIKVWFHASQINRQHSVYKDRHQVIKGLSEDPRFNVYFSTFDPLNAEVKYTFGNAKHIILPRDLKKIRDQLTKEKIDILVYCEIGMDATSNFMSFMKLAKIQCNTWGHSDTSGIDSIDYYFSSKLYELPYEQAQTHYSEKLILQNSLCTSYVNPCSRHDISTFKSRFHFGFTNDCVIYFCAQSLFKLNPIYDEYLIKILTFVEKSVIVFLEGKDKDKIIRRFDNTGIGHKIRFMPMMEHFVYMNLISISDVFLDVFPFGGCNSSFEAFSLGKVVVTRPSIMINGRFTTGFYKKMGLDYMINNTKEEYIDMAIRLGNEPEYRKKLEKEIRENSSKLFLDKETIEEWKNDLVKIYSDYEKNTQ